jgi:hypothetical protein
VSQVVREKDHRHATTSEFAPNAVRRAERPQQFCHIAGRPAVAAEAIEERGQPVHVLYHAREHRRPR